MHTVYLLKKYLMYLYCVFLSLHSALLYVQYHVIGKFSLFS